MEKMRELKPYKVGEYDMVAAVSEEQAIQILMDYCPDFYEDEELTTDDVTDCSSQLDKMVFDDDNEPTQTLRDYVEECNGVPQYLYGRE